MSILAPEKEETTELEDIPTLPEEPNVSETVTVLKKAKDYISDPKRWSKGHLREPDGSVCTLGAIFVGAGCDFEEAWGSSVLNDEQVEALYCLESLVPSRCVASFNDLRSTRHEDVIKLYDRAIELAESKGI